MTTKYRLSDSESSVTFSNSGSTPNGSLGSETDDEPHDDLSKYVYSLIRQ